MGLVPSSPLLAERLWEVELAFQAAKEMGEKFNIQLRQGIELLEDRYKMALLEMLKNK